MFVTGDRNLSFQQNLTNFNIAVIVLEAQTTRLIDTLQLMPQVLASLEPIQPGQVTRLRPEP